MYIISLYFHTTYFLLGFKCFLVSTIILYLTTLAVPLLFFFSIMPCGAPWFNSTTLGHNPLQMLFPEGLSKGSPSGTGCCIWESQFETEWVRAWTRKFLCSFKQLWKVKDLPLFSQVKELSKDTQAVQYFVKLHIIAGQMSSKQLNNTSIFYTLTGKAGEIFNGAEVGTSQMFTFKIKLFVNAHSLAALCFTASIAFLILVSQRPSPYRRKQRSSYIRIL